MAACVSAEFTVNSMYMWQGETHCGAYINTLLTPYSTPLPTDLINQLSIYRVAVRTRLVNGHFLLRSQGDSTRQRHGDGCRVPVSHHLFINLKSFTYNSISEDADVFFFLYDTREAKQIRYTEASQWAHKSPEWSVKGKEMQRQTHTHTHTHTHTSKHYLCSADWRKLSVVNSELTSFAVRSSWWNWTKMADQRIQRRWIVSVPSSR